MDAASTGLGTKGERCGARRAIKTYTEEFEFDRISWREEGGVGVVGVTVDVLGCGAVSTPFSGARPG